MNHDLKMNRDFLLIVLWLFLWLSTWLSIYLIIKISKDIKRTKALLKMQRNKFLR